MSGKVILNGHFGGFALVAEATYGTDPATGYTWMPAATKSYFSVKPIRERIPVERPGLVPVAAPPFDVMKVEGNTVNFFSTSDAVVGVILRAFGIRTGSTAPFTYTIDGTTSGYPPSTNSFTILDDKGIVTAPSTHKQFAATGMKPTRVLFDFKPGQPVIMTTTWVGRGYAAKGSPVAISAPADTVISYPSDYPTITLAGSAFGFESAQIIVDLPKVQPLRFGATAQSEPIPSDGQIVVSYTMAGNYGNDTGHDYVAELDDFLGSGTFGTVIMGSAQARFTLTSARVDGDWPDSVTGPIPVTLKGQAAGLIINTSA